MVRVVVHRILPAIAFIVTAALTQSVDARQQPPAVTVPAGTALYLRLQTPVSTKTSKVGQAIAATVVRDVSVQGGVAIPVGAAVKGKVEKCSQPSRPDQRAELLLSFTKLDIPAAGSLTLAGHLSGVANARETFLEDGTIVGVLESEAPAALLSSVLAKLGASSPDIQKQIEKQKIGQVNTAIEYGQGTDILFTLTEPLAVGQVFASAGPQPLFAAVLASLRNALTRAPQRSVSRDNKPGDPINLVFIGTTQEIEQAFHAAGWAEPRGKNGRSILDTARAVINDDGYGLAPVSDLYLYGRKEDLAFEKVLNTFNKRHHLRLWQAPARAQDGRPIWLGAATHDTGIDIHPGVVSHATDPNLDDERGQVQADLSGSGIRGMQLISPPNPLSTGNTATGGAWHTDGQLLAIDLKPAPTNASSP